MDKETAHTPSASPRQRTNAPKDGRPRVRLPFDNRRTDAGSWAYDHRRGLAITVIAYLLIGIAFVAGKVSVSGKRAQTTITVDLQTLAQLDEERERLQREVEARQREQMNWRAVQNLASNENALNENLRDDRGSNTAQLNRQAGEVEDQMRANRERYERGLAEAQSLGERPEEQRHEDAESSRKVAGMVTVSYSLNNPVRHATYLHKPAYKCEGGGDVVVNITVNRDGEVTAASVASGGDACMRETALHAARISKFDINASAPAKQQGTIRYIFIPQ